MPDNILVDNYHVGFAHIHPDPENHEIKDDDSERIKELVEMIK